MRNATGPNSPPGGSTAVRGQPPPVKTWANVMRAREEDCDDICDDNGEYKAYEPQILGWLNAMIVKEIEDDEKDSDDDSGEEDSNPRPSFLPTTGSINDVHQASSSVTPPSDLQPDPEYVQDYVTQVQAKITQSLQNQTWLRDFPKRYIPPRQHNEKIHDHLHQLLSQREHVELELTDMLDDKAADGTLLDPKPDYEAGYLSLSKRYDDLNRSMHTTYANASDLRYGRDAFLYKALTRKRLYSQFAAPSHALTTKAQRKNKEPLTGVDPATHPQALALTSTLRTEINSLSAPPTPEVCPYQHIREGPPRPPTVPTFDTIPMPLEPMLSEKEDGRLHVFSVYQGDPAPTRQVTAIADSGASHVLIRQSDAAVLHEVQYRHAQEPPYATLIAANGGELQAIGRGYLIAADVTIIAYVFLDRDLSVNLLGLAPFSERNCTTVFSPHTFRILKPNNDILLSGHRDPPPESVDCGITRRARDTPSAISDQAHPPIRCTH
jgi:hypothetical protein